MLTHVQKEPCFIMTARATTLSPVIIGNVRVRMRTSTNAPITQLGGKAPGLHLKHSILGELPGYCSGCSVMGEGKPRVI